MSKITKKMFDDYNSSKKEVIKSNKKHQKDIDKIIDVVKSIISKNFKGKNWRVTGIEFCYDSYIDYNKKSGEQYEWVEISEDEYYKIYDEKRFDKNFKYDEYLKEEYIEKPEFHINHYKKIEKRYKYLRVYVYEWWRYGGEDNIEFDFLLSDIMDDTYLRKEKLEKITS